MKTFLPSVLRQRAALLGIAALAGIVITVVHLYRSFDRRPPVVFQPIAEDRFEARTADYTLTLAEGEARMQGQEGWALQLPPTAKPEKKGSEIWYDDLYSGIDLRFYDKGRGNAGYDLILEPGTHPDKIRLELKGEGAAYIDGNGDLVLPTAAGEIRHSAPYTYQVIEGEKVEVESRFRLVSRDLALLTKYERGEVLGVELGSFDPTRSVVIDPEISFISKHKISTNAPLASYNLTGDLGTLNIPCGIVNDFYDSGGSGGTYGDGQDFEVTFCASNGQSVTFDFLTTSLAGGDVVSIYDGPNTSSPLFAGALGSNGFGLRTSTGNCLTFRFVSNAFGVGNGWEAKVSCSETTTTNACTGSFVDSGGGAAAYRDVENSTTTICSDNGGQPQVSFSIFDIELNFDFMRIYDGATTASTLLGTYTGTTSPGTVTGSGTCLTFNFTSDGVGTAPGWNAAISCIGGGPVGTADYTMDGGNQTTCTGVFADSGDNVTNYSNSENYTATFCSGTSEQIVFTFSEFNTELNADLLYIYDGANTSAPQVSGSPFSGSGPLRSPGAVSSTGTCLTFVFTSNGSVTSLGWQADITCSGDAGSTAGPTWTGYPTSLACGSMTQLGGTVFDDFDNNGARGAREPGIRNISVALFDDNGQVGASTTTDASGNFTFSGLTPTVVYRVEFTVPVIWQEGAFGSGSGTAVQFVQAGQCNANLGLIDKARLCTDANPNYIVPCYVNGDPTHASNSSSTSIARFLYNDSGNSPAASYSNWATMGTIGTVWGAAFNAEDQQVYASAFLKRHAGLGPNGIGAIYRRPVSGTNTSAVLFYDFGAAAGTVANNATRFPGSGNAFGQVGPCGVCDNIDPTTFAQVGKVGFGSMEMSPDDKFLYVTNLSDRKVYKIDATTNSPAPGSATALPGTPWLANTGCSGVSRPFGLKYYRGKLYVGVICDGSGGSCNPTAACNDLTATVYTYDGSAWSTVLSFPMNYYRKAYATGSNYWVRWIDDWNVMSPYVANKTDAQFSQPIFAGIEFDDDGSLIMSFADRTSYQLGYQAPPPPGPSSSTAERNFVHGDILRAYYNPNTQTFSLENNGVAGPLTTTNPSSTSGPGGKSFYWGDYWYGAYNNSGVGSMSLVPGKGEVMFSLGDPIDPYANGIAFISNTNGKSNRRIEVYQGSPSGNAPNFAKSGGLGQIVVQCAAADVEIGNYVWWDSDLDGLMDPGEPGIPNVSLRLYRDPDGNTQGNNPFNGDEVHVATTTTDAYGRYIFSKSGASNGLNAQTWQPGHTRVLTETTYQVRIVNWATDPGLTAFATGAGSPVFALSPTQNQGAGGGQRDNNAYDNPGNAGAAALTGLSGENNHSFDFAFGPNGCTAPDLMPTANTPCVGDDLTLMANATGGVPPYTYSWTGPNGFASTDENPTIANVTTAADGDYHLTVTDNVGCDATFVLPVVVNEIAITATPTNPSCGMNNGSIDVEIASGGLAPFTYDWSNNALDGTEDPTNLAAGSYTVTVTDANGCTDTETVNLSGSGGPTVMIVGTNPTCGQSNGSIALTVSGGTPGYTFDWSNNALDGTEDPTGLAAGAYMVTVTDGASCSSVANVTLVSANPPSLSETHTNATCGAINGTIDITVTDGTGPYTFDWDDVAGTSNSEDRASLGAGTYTVTVTDAGGCTDNVSVVIMSSTAPTLTVDPTDETCGSSNGAVDLTVNGGTAPFTYDWSYDGTGDNDDPEDPSGLAAGTYNVTVTDANNCTATVGVTLMNSDGPTNLTFVVTNATSCLLNNGVIGLTVTGGMAPYAYDWDNDGESPPDYDSEDLSNLTPGTYTVTVTDANGCTLTGSATVGLVTGATLSTVVTDPTTCTETGSVNLTISGGVSPYTIAWSNGAVTEDLTGLAPGLYTVTVTENNGCQVTENVSIRDIREPVLSVVNTAPTCGMSNGVIDLTISDPDGMGPYTIMWADGPTTEDRSGLPAGAYTVTVTNGISCTSVLVVNLNAASAPELSLFQTNETCTDGNGAIDLFITGGMGPYTIDWDNIPGAPNLEDQMNLSAGTYNVTVTDAMGCVATGTVVLTDSPDPVLSATATAETCVGSDGTIDLTVDGVGPFTYDWSDNTYDGVEDPTGVSQGNYSVTVTDAAGCTAVQMIAVPTDCSPSCNITITATDLSSCTGNMFDATLSLDWMDAPVTGNMEYSIDGGPFQTLTRTNFAANVVGEIIVIPDLICNSTEMIEIRFEGHTACYEQVMFVFPPADPAGYLYCVETGEVIAGGMIAVTPPLGGSINIVEDGSTGHYFWVATGSPITEGIYQMTYTAPAGYAVTGTPGVRAGDTDDVLDPTGGSEDNPGNANPLNLGSDVNGGGTQLNDFSTAANPYFLEFDLELGDPFVDRNNLPLSGCCDVTINSVTVSGCYQNGGQSMATISVEVAWNGAPAGETLIVTGPPGSVPATRTITPGTITVDYGYQVGTNASQTIVSPQVVAFEIPANGSGGLTVQAAFSTTTACSATSSTFSLPDACPPLVCGGDQTGGTVFQDYNADGIQGSGETNGLAGVTVTAYNCEGSIVGTTTTDADGNYVFSGLTATDYPIRVEFSGLPALYGNGTPNGTDGRTTVQFIDAPECNVDLGLLNPNDFCQDDPLVFVPCFVNGDPLVAGTTATADAIVMFSYSSSGTPGQAGYTAPTQIATASEVGTLWGTAYNRFTNRIFMSTTLKRHAGLGPLGIGGIYAVDMTNPGAPVVSNFVDVETDLGIDVDDPGSPVLSNAARGLTGDKTVHTNDPTVISQIGRVGIGDIDLSADGNTLWFVNLYDKTLYSVDISAYNADGVTLPTAGNVQGLAIPDPNCTGGTYRPFGLKVYEGDVYVGVICDGGTSQNKSDLRAFVYKWDGGSWSTVFDFPLTYPKGFADASTQLRNRTGWYPWTDDWATFTAALRPISASNMWVYPMPILADIEFDIDGSMVLGFSDRAGFIGGSGNFGPTGATNFTVTVGGDFLRAYFSGGSYILENAAKAGPITGYAPSNNQGPGFGEFFDENLITSYNGGAQSLDHAETALGALAILPGSGEVLVTAIDPVGFDIPASFTPHPYDIGGLIRSNTATGAKNGGYGVYQGTNDNGLYGKSVGLGDIELGCNPPTYLQIGNYVWVDTDEDGVQDACEEPVQGVIASLYNKTTGTFLASTTTGANGEYYFTGLGAPNETWVATAGYDSLQPNTQYIVVFGLDGAVPANNQFDPATGYLTAPNGLAYELTVQDSGEGSSPDLNDSDGMIAAPAAAVWDNFPVIMHTTGADGSVDHTLDLGLINAVVSLGSTVFADDNNNGVQDGSEAGIQGVTVQLFDAANVEIPVGPDGILNTPDDAPGGMTTDAQGNYFFQGLAPGDYYVQIPASEFGAGNSLESYPISSNGGAVSGGETDPDDNTDSDDQGQQAGGSGTVVTSQVITLLGGTEPDNTLETGQGAAQDDANDTNGNMTLDFGFFAPVSVGDYTWVDENGDGLQTGGEAPLAGVTVTLFNADGSPVTLDAEGNAYTNTQMTNALGNYLFEDLPPGDYYVVFDISTVDNAGLYTLTTQDSDGNVSDGTDSDAATVGPNIGQTANTGFLNSGESDLSLDAGVQCAVEAEIVTMQLTLCGNRTVDLTSLGATITPASLGGNWTTSGTGAFDGGGVWGIATTYTPSAADIVSGGVTLTLTTNNPGGLAPPSPCDPASDDLEIIILKVDCGTFPWNGN